MKVKHVVLASAVLAAILVSILLIALYYQPTPFTAPSVHLIGHEWDVKVVDWEHEYVEVNVTLLNSGNASAEFVLEVDLYDEGEYVTCQLWGIELPAKHEETFTRSVPYELLFNKHRPDAIRIIGGIYGEDDVLKEEYFRFPPKEDEE
jgi:hypothetical protein